MRYSDQQSEVNEKIDELIQFLDVDEAKETYLRQLMVTVAQLADDPVGELDMKIITNSTKEMRYAFKIFAEYPDRKKISVFGSARSSPEDDNYKATVDFCEEAADRDYMIISGAGPGIMEAANKGAGRENSFGLHITIPHEYQPNTYIKGDKKCINFRYFFSRKLLFSKESSASIYFPGGFGTHDELFELLCLMQTGRHHLTPLILCDRNNYWENFQEYVSETLLEHDTIDESDLGLLDYVTDPSSAVDIIDNFYSNYHSSRFLDEEFLIRFKNHPSQKALDKLEDEFLHLCPESGFRVEEGPIEGEEKDAPEDLYRLIFYYTNQDYGELRELVRMINSW